MNSIAGFQPSQTNEPSPKSFPELNGSAWAMRETSRQLARGVSEMRLTYGPGYRVYYKQTGKKIILILCGGDKSTQDNDIKRAKEIAAQL